MMFFFYDYMVKSFYEMMFYVNSFGRILEVLGIIDFLELLCYFIGYVVLFYCIGFMFEMYMFKFYKDRVEFIYIFMQGMVEILIRDVKDIVNWKQESKVMVV